MDGRLKQRMVGAAVLIALGVIFIPVLLDESGRKQTLEPIPDIPEQPVAPEPIPLPTEPIVLKGPAVEEIEQPVTEFEPEPPPPPKPVPNAGVDTGDLSAWVVQLGSFSEKNNAEQLTRSLQDAGFSAFVESITKDGKPSHRVRVGPIMTQQKANQIRKRISKEHNQKGVLMRYRGPVDGG